MLTRPLAHTALLLVSFALLMTIHLVLTWSLLRSKTPAWHGLLVLVPVLAWLAPYWGFKAGMKLRAGFWCCCCVAYVIALVGALRV